MSATDQYRRSIDSLAEAIRAACELITKTDPQTYALAMQKRDMEKQLRAAGYSQTQARAAVSRAFKIQHLENK